MTGRASALPRTKLRQYSWAKPGSRRAASPLALSRARICAAAVAGPAPRTPSPRTVKASHSILRQAIHRSVSKNEYARALHEDVDMARLPSVLHRCRNGTGVVHVTEVIGFSKI